MNINFTNINSIDFDNVFKSHFPTEYTTEKKEFFDTPGNEHYRLLAYLATQFNNSSIFDIGTSSGQSALALSFNSSNTVHTFNIQDELSKEKKQFKWKDCNIKFHLENLWDTDILKKWKQELLNSPFIFIDVDPHNGHMEYDFYKWLEENQYKGIVLFDDVLVTDLMKYNFWFRIPSEHKIDLTKYGHFSGTGLIKFPWSNTCIETNF
jgi:predicted O-methyltransferase YrrM